MFTSINRNLNKLCMKCQFAGPRKKKKKSRPKIVQNEDTKSGIQCGSNSIIVRTKDGKQSQPPKIIRLATFNVALFSMAPAVLRRSCEESVKNDGDSQISVKTDLKGKSAVGSSNSPPSRVPRSILKQIPTSPVIDTFPKKKLKFGEGTSRLKVSINLPDNEISLSRRRHSKVNVVQDPSSSRHGTGRLSLSPNSRSKSHLSSSPKSPAPVLDSISPTSVRETSPRIYETFRGSRTILEVLREVNADLVALQEVKAEEEKGMRPLSELAEALGMNYAFAESWAPEYGNAVLSKWPIKSWDVQKIVDDSDFRNVLKVVIDIPESEELHLQCTHLDHLDENWRMKQIMAIMGGNDHPHILVGGLNSLDTTDYSQERWEDIVKFYKDKGKPMPKGEVIRALRGKGYIDAKHFVGDCESVVVLARGQEVQGTCKYGTRVDYILASRDAPYKFVPGSYSVVSSKGTSDHHVVTVDVVIDVNESHYHSVAFKGEGDLGVKIRALQSKSQ